MVEISHSFKLDMRSSFFVWGHWGIVAENVFHESIVTILEPHLETARLRTWSPIGTFFKCQTLCDCTTISKWNESVSRRVTFLCQRKYWSAITVSLIRNVWTSGEESDQISWSPALMTLLTLIELEWMTCHCHLFLLNKALKNL